MRSNSAKADSIDPSTSLPVQDSHDPTTVTESAEPIDPSTETTASNEQGLGSTESPSDSGVDPLLIVNSSSSDGIKGDIKASETIGPAIEAVIGNRKRLLRVDIEPNGKLQIQSGSGKNSIVDFRPDLSKPLAPQINEAFKRQPKFIRDQLIKKAEKGLKRLQDTGNM